jgi:hypothetical protein
MAIRLAVSLTLISGAVATSQESSLSQTLKLGPGLVRVDLGQFQRIGHL